MRILITGASGFLGSHVVEAALKRGHTPVALVRKSSSLSFLRGLSGVELCYADIRNPQEIGVVLSMMDAVIHCAGLTKARNEEEFHEVNAKGTRVLLEAAATRCPSLRRFVYVSSLAAHGPSDGPSPRSEEDEARPVSSYGRSKRAGEEETLRFQDDIPVAIVRPPGIYGPRYLEFLKLFQLAKLRLLPVPGDGKGVLSLISAEDCAEALLTLVENVIPTGAIFHVDDGERYTMRQLGEAVFAEVGHAPVPLPVPMMVLRMAAKIGDSLGGVLGRNFWFNSDKLSEIEGRHWVAGHEALRRATGWRPSMTLAEGVKRMHQWYKSEGLL